ncbi:glycosyltransferase family 2 protein [Halomarina litorea]|uniref:glycosyltransferase family 2 protein n=1 Tax=Halomarina litorea TaxID=2961595 RepID=UPI0020C53E97|nr:glycosyltransferase [Halomarina sp. BCD28]
MATENPTPKPVDVPLGDRVVEETSDTDWPLLPPESAQAPLVSVVLPTLNEERGIRECIASVQSALRELDVTGEIIVSDSSTDDTPAIARAMGARVVEPDGAGYGYAYRYAFEHARGEYIVMGDADTTYDFRELPALFALVADGDADIAMGSRLKGEIQPGAMPALHRYVGNPMLTRFLNTFYDADVSDAHSGFRVFTRDALDRLDLTSNGMEFASEMVMDASTKGLTIAETPITYSRREGDATLDSFHDGWRHVKFMLKNSPGYLFLAPAVGFALLGVLTIVVSLTGQRFAGLNFGTHTLVAGGFLCVIGFQVGSLGLFSAVATDPIRRAESPIVDGILERFSLEHGAAFGLALTGLGVAYIVMMFSRWVASGYTALPFIGWDIIAFTALIIGVQTVFHSFFLSMLGDDE